MPPLNCNEKVTCENCGTETAQKTISSHKKKFSIGTLYCTLCSNFSTISQIVFNCHIARKHPRIGAKSTYKCKFRLKEFSAFYVPPKHRRTHRGLPIKTSSPDMDSFFDDVDDTELKNKPTSGKQFLVDSELERGRHDVFISPGHPSTSLSSAKIQIICTAASIVLQKSTIPSSLLSKSLKMERVDISMNTKTIRLWKFRSSCAHKMIWQTEREHAKNGYCWPLHKIKSESIMEIPQTYKSYSFCTVTTIWKRRHRKLSIALSVTVRKQNPRNFKMFTWTTIQKLRTYCSSKYLYDIDFVDREVKGELARRSNRKFDKSVKLLHYNNYNCYVNNINAIFKAFP